MRIPQIEPITTMAKNHKAVLTMLANGPVILAQRSRPAAVLLSVNDYDKLIKRLEQFELLAEAKRVLADIDSGKTGTTSYDELKRLLSERQTQGTVVHVGA